MILPALTEAKSPFFRPIKYSLFPPLGLATLAGYLRDDDEVALQDEHVEELDLEDEPDLVVIQVYITSARRAYELADRYRRKGVWVALGGLHVTSVPAEAKQHADSVFVGPGEDTWPAFLDDFRAGPCQGALPFDGADAGWSSAHPARPDQALALPRPELDRRFPRAVRTCVISATRKPSSRVAAVSTRRGSRTLWPRSSGFRDATSTSSTTICWGTPALPPNCSMECEAWDGCGKPPGPFSQCCVLDC